MSFAGIFALLGLGYVLSVNRRSIRWRPVLGGVVLQLVIALVILKTRFGLVAFKKLGSLAETFLNYTDAGSTFLFGAKYVEHYFAFKVLAILIFFSSCMAIAYYLRLVQPVVKFLAKIMMKTLGTSGAESLSAAGNIFVGPTEAPLLIRPYVSKMTQSELMAVMTVGFATIAGTVFGAYVSFGIDSAHLLAASVMSAPAALAFAKMMVPETEAPLTMGKVSIEVQSQERNVIEAAANGASDGMKLALNVAAMLLAFVAIIALCNGMLGKVGEWIGFPALSLEYLFGWVGAPIAFFIGVPLDECFQVGTLISQKVIINEFIAYDALGSMVKEGTLSERSIYLSTYALCGFSNLSTIAIQIGGIGAIAPERKSDLARLGLRAMIGGNLACFMTANIAGMMI